MEELMANLRKIKEQRKTNSIEGPPGPPPPPPARGLLCLVVGAKGRQPFDNNGCVGVYTDLENNTETYLINDVYVKRKICSTDDEEAAFDRNNPLVPVSIRGLKKITLSRPPSPPRSISNLTGSNAGSLIDTREVAEAALAYFNKKHNTDYKLVEPRYSFAIYVPHERWMHANFTAKPGAALDGGNGDSSIKLFFAEGKFVRGEEIGSHHYEITACCILDGVETTKKCGKCPDHALISHPTSGFRKGCCVAQPRVLCPQKGSKVVKT